MAAAGFLTVDPAALEASSPSVSNYPEGPSYPTITQRVHVPHYYGIRAERPYIPPHIYIYIYTYISWIWGPNSFNDNNSNKKNKNNKNNNNNKIINNNKDNSNNNNNTSGTGNCSNNSNSGPSG